MKKAIIVFSLSLSLIIIGGLLTASEFSKWNQTDKTYLDYGYQTKTSSVDVNIKDYKEASISLNSRYYYDNMSELEPKIVIDKDQEEGVLSQNIIYYPQLGHCDTNLDNYIIDDSNDKVYIDNKDLTTEKVYLEIDAYCRQDNFNPFRLSSQFSKEDFKVMMQLKRIPANIHQVVITINPNDENKLINQGD